MVAFNNLIFPFIVSSKMAAAPTTGESSGKIESKS